MLQDIERPEIPVFRRLVSMDGKVRLYLIAPTPFHIEMMMNVCGLKKEGIRKRHEGCYFRIIKKWEEKIVKKHFP